MPIRRITRDCFECKRRRSEPMKQKMSDLPEDRVSPGKPPFQLLVLTILDNFLLKEGEHR